MKRHAKWNNQMNNLNQCLSKENQAKLKALKIETGITIPEYYKMILAVFGYKSYKDFESKAKIKNVWNGMVTAYLKENK